MATDHLGDGTRLRVVDRFSHRVLSETAVGSWGHGVAADAVAGRAFGWASEGVHMVSLRKKNLDDFIKSLESPRPPAALEDSLAALWWDQKGDWDRAHSIAQNISSVQGSAVHAYLHREEGVLWNADYWYARAGRKRPEIDLAEEWRLLAEEMLQTPG